MALCVRNGSWRSSSENFELLESLSARDAARYVCDHTLDEIKAAACQWSQTHPEAWLSDGAQYYSDTYSVRAASSVWTDRADAPHQLPANSAPGL
jgi:hypothetical protein